VFVPFKPADDAAYAYLLGWYLGDGCISKTTRSYQLVITADLAYFWIIVECCRAIRAAVPGRVPRVNPHPVHNCVRIESGWTDWPEVFPQHAPGRKHERPIVLEPWQEAIVEAHPWQFLRGLLHSDGCRTINRFKTKLPSGRVAEYEYPRWFFSNMSEDIRGLFCRTCEQLGLRWTQSNHRNMSISHRHSVALLEEHVGPKT
jgi:hypothetical protein